MLRYLASCCLRFSKGVIPNLMHRFSNIVAITKISIFPKTGLYVDLFEKAAMHKMHWKSRSLSFLTGFNFNNILQAAFTLANPKSGKKLLNLTVFFMLLGTARVKAAHRMLVKLTPGFPICDVITDDRMSLVRINQSDRVVKS